MFNPNEPQPLDDPQEAEDLMQSLDQAGSPDTPSYMERILRYQQERQQILTFIDQFLHAPTDFLVEGNSRFLRKAGAQKIAQFLGLRPEFAPSHSLGDWSYNPESKAPREWDAPRVFSFQCSLHRVADLNVRLERSTFSSYPLRANGYGSVDMEEENALRFGWTANACLKMAEKRAFVDAVIWAAGIGDLFSQDMDEGLGSPAPNPPPAPRGVRSATAEPPVPEGRVFGGSGREHPDVKPKGARTLTNRPVGR